MSIVINKNDWKYYLTRPFNLFEASIWHEWYRSDLMKELVGMKLSCGLYLEYPVNNARSYKKPSEIDHYMKLASDVALDREKSLKILADAEALNEKAKKFLAGELTFSFEESIKFLNLLVIYSILPYYIGNGRTDDKEILEKVNRLRSISFYPKILEKIVIPAAENKIIELGYDKEILKVTTLTELLSGKIHPERLKERKLFSSYIYLHDENGEQIDWTNNVEQIIDEIQGLDLSKITKLTGTVACPGFVKGVVRLAKSNNVSNIIFNQGDILVAASTNPSLVTLMHKAGAIVTDEGGLTSHAAILSRELKVPCVINTGIATRIFKDGDVMEVDANNGTVRLIK